MNNYNNIKNNSVKDEKIEIKRNGKKHAGIVARGIICGVLVAGSLTALYIGSNNKVKDNNKNIPVMHETIKEQSSEKSDEKVLTSEEKLDLLFDGMSKYADENKIEDLTSYYEEHYFDLYGEEANKDIIYLYSANAYKKAIDAGLKNEDIIKELDFMYQMQEIPSCFPETLLDNVKNLYSSIDETKESLFMIYGPLSVVTHNETCDKEHVINAAGGISHKGEEPDFDIHYAEPEKVMVLSK